MASLASVAARVCIVLTCVAGALSSSAANAGAFNMGMLTNTLSTDHVRQEEAARAVNQQISSLSTQGVASPAAKAASFIYRQDRNRTQKNLRTFINSAPNAAAKAELEQLLSAQPNIMTEIRQGIAPYGFDGNNVADAYALWWINSWLVANKRDEDPDRGTVAMVKQQVYNAFAATPDFSTHSDGDRQEFAEVLMLQAVLLSNAFDQVKSDPAQLGQLADITRQGAKMIGLDLMTMDLTRNGFVPRQGADASDASESALPSGEEAVQNAAADSDDESSMALAVAAGAGLGAVLLGGAVFMRRQG